MKTEATVSIGINSQERFFFEVEGKTARGGKYKKRIEFRSDYPIPLDDFKQFLEDCGYEIRNWVPLPNILYKGWNYGSMSHEEAVQHGFTGPGVTGTYGPDWEPGQEKGYKDIRSTPFGRSPHYNPKTNYNTDMGSRAFADGWNAKAYAAGERDMETHRKISEKPNDWPDIPADSNQNRPGLRTRDRGIAHEDDFKFIGPTEYTGTVSPGPGFENYAGRIPIPDVGPKWPDFKLPFPNDDKKSDPPKNWGPSIHKDPGEGE